MIGAETPVITQGQKLSILFARASSNAPALHGLAKSIDGAGWAGLPGCVDEATSPPTGWSSDGERMGEENDRRYRPIKKSSLKKQKMKSTVYTHVNGIDPIVWKQLPVELTLLL
jgi:hypothetical protein